jgi:hypothetical protein
MADDLWQLAQHVEQRNAAQAAIENERKRDEEAKRLEGEKRRRQERLAKEPAARRQLIEVGRFAAKYFPSRSFLPTDKGWRVYGSYLSSDGSWFHRPQKSDKTWHHLTIEDIISAAFTGPLRLNDVWYIDFELAPSRLESPLYLWSGGLSNRLYEGPYQEVMVEQIVRLCDHPERMKAPSGEPA